jgi:hypothetical protein
MEKHLKDKGKDVTYFSLALDESSDACGTAQLLTFTFYGEACFNAVNEEHNRRETFIGGV